MGITEILGDKRAEIIAIAAKHRASNVRVFGSVARGDADEDSDVDFLVVLHPEASLMDHAALLVELEELLGRKVDVAPECCLRPRARARILKEAVPL